MTTSNFGYEISDNEYFYNLIKIKPIPDTIPVNVPKFMPKIPLGSPTQSVAGINRSMFANASECKPRPSSTIGIQNYLTLQHQANEHPDYTYKMNRKDNLVPKFSKFLLKVLHNDIRNIYFTGSI